MKTFLFILLIVFSETFFLSAQEKWTTYNIPQPLELCSNYVTAIAFDVQNNKWFGTKDAGVSKFDGTNWTTYNTTNGLVSNNISAIAIDAQGNKWFGTDNGVSFFDGTNWTTYNTTNGLVSNTISSIVIDAQGNKWFGTYAGISKFDGTNWTTYNTTNGLASNTITAIAIDAQGNKWFGTDNGVSFFDGTNWTTYNTTNGLVCNAISAIAIDPKGNKWFGTHYFNSITHSAGFGVSKFDGTNWKTYTTTDGLAGDCITNITVDAQGNILVGTETFSGSVGYLGSGVSEFDGTNWTQINGLAGYIITAIAVDNQGNKWFGTVSRNAYNSYSYTGTGVSKFDGTNWTGYGVAPVMNNAVSSIAIDAQGNKWFGTYTTYPNCPGCPFSLSGVFKFDNTNWTTYNTEQNVINILAIAIDAQGNKWFGTDTGVSKFDGTNWSYYTNISGRVLTIAIDAQNNKWFGTYYGTYKYDGTNWTNYTTADGLLSNDISCVFIDNQNNQWIGTQPSSYKPVAGGGISKFNNNTLIKNYNAKDGIISNNISSITMDKQSNLWVGAYSIKDSYDTIDIEGGLSKFDGTNWKNFTIKDGLVSNNVFCIASDSKGNIWVGTDNGVSRFDGTGWKTYTTNDGLAGNIVNVIAIDAQDNKWFGTNNGISKLEGAISIGIKEIKEYLGCKIYPNPINDKFTIQIDNIKELYTLEIFNTTGQVVLSKQLTNSIEQVDLSGQAAGVYFVKLQSLNNSVVRKVIKQ